MDTDDQCPPAGRYPLADQAPQLGSPDPDGRRAEDRLRRERDEARAELVARSDLLAHVSHEIRTPMNGILGMIELTLGTPLAAGQREALEIARSSAESLLAILDETLDLSRLDAGKLHAEPVEFDPGRLVEQATRLLAPGAHFKGLRLICRVDPSTPSLVVADAQRFRQILLNLLGNAIKFTPRGRVSVVLAATAGPGETRLVLTVADTGVGIPASKHQAVFGPFEQAEPSIRRRFGGTGLGLSISNRLARLLGGEIRLESRPGAGSTFTCELPVEVVERASSPPAERPLAGLKVGLVLSEPLRRESLIQLIGGAGGVPVDWDGSVGDGLDCIVTDVWPADLPVPTPAPVVVLEPFGTRVWGRGALTLPQREAGKPDWLVQPGPLPKAGDWLDSDPPELAGILSLDGIGPEQAAGPAGRIVVPIVRADAVAVLARVARPREAGPMPGGGAASASAPTPGTGIGTLTGRRLRVLLAEDNPVGRIVGTRMLEELGHEVLLAEDGFRAVELAESGGLDLALMDVQMPGLDGHSALVMIRGAEARAGRRRLPVAALTAHARPEDRARHLRDGFDAFLTKPLRPADLRLSIARLVPEPDPAARAASASGPAAGELGRELLQLCGGDRLFLRDLVSVFLDSAPRALDRLGEAHLRGDLRVIGSESHGLRGMCLTIGASGLAAIARDLEDLATTGGAEAVPRLLAEAGAAWAVLRAELLDLQQKMG